MYKVKDYKFETEKEAKEAQSELKAVEYLRTKVDMNQPQAALEIYRQLIDQDIFHTIVGYDFLKGLQNFLRTSPAVDNKDIPQIPDALAQGVLPKITNDAQQQGRQKPEGGVQATAKAPAPEPVPLSSLTPVPKLNEQAHREAEAEEAARGRASKKKAEKKERKPRREKRSGRERGKKERKPLFSFLKRKKVENDAPREKKGEEGSSGGVDGRYKRYAYMFGATTAVLSVALIAMILIAMTGNHPTILDYKNKVINEYSSWEQDLSNKEKELKSREKDVEFRENALQNQTFAPKKSSNGGQQNETVVTEGAGTESSGDEATQGTIPAEDTGAQGTVPAGDAGALQTVPAEDTGAQGTVPDGDAGAGTTP